MIRRCSILLSSLILVAALSTSAWAQQDRYFVVLFGYESPLNLPSLSHSFASFVRVDGTTGAVTEDSISWLPQNLAPNLSVCVHLLFPRRCPPEPGHNYGLTETINLATQANRTVLRAGPFEIDRGLYDYALAQITQLESGRVQYVARDNRTHGLTGHTSTHAVNCIHALSDVSGSYLPRNLRWGFLGTLDVLDVYAPWIIDASSDFEWVAAEIGVDQIPRAR